MFVINVSHQTNFHVDVVSCVQVFEAEADVMSCFSHVIPVSARCSYAVSSRLWHVFVATTCLGTWEFIVVKPLSHEYIKWLGSLGPET